MGRFINHKKTLVANLLSFTTLFLILSGSSLQASENAKVEGIVVDAVTGNPLPGANVFLEGTSLGSSTDLDGYFLITEVPPGPYSLRIIYIGYKQLDVAIEVKAKDVITKKIELSSEAVKGEAVFVTAQAEGQMAAINQQLSAQSIVNVVSAAQIQELPDANAAESLRRLPGVSITRVGGEGSQVVIRGLAPKYNVITIDGIRIASSNSNDRSADLSMISPNMLDGIEVSKTVTADQDADVLGGTVNFKLRKANTVKQGWGIHLLAQGGYTGLSNAYNKTNNYKLVPSIENRFFNNRLGVFVQANLERRNLTSNDFGASYTNKSADQINYITQSLNLHYIYRDRQRNNGTLVLDYNLPRVSVHFTNFINSSITEIENRYETFDINAGVNARNQHVYSLGHSKSTLNLISNALIIEGQLPFFHADLKLSHNYSETKNPDDWTVNFRLSPAGIGQFENVENLNPGTVIDSVLTDPAKTKLHTISTNDNYAKERTLMVSLDLDRPLNLSKTITSVIKFGGKYRRQERSYTSEVYGTNATFISPSAQGASRMIIDHFGIPTNDPTAIPLSFFVDENFDYGNFLEGDYEMHSAMNFGLVKELVGFSEDNVDAFRKAGSAEAFARNNYLSATNNYSGDEILTAGYVMATINIGPKLRVIPGIRYQNLRTSYSGIRGQQSAISYFNYDHSDTTTTINHPYWLPNVNLQYKPLSWFDVRLAYSTTLSYPDFNTIIPRIDVTTGAALAWNDFLLKPSRSKNYDAYFTFSENTVGLLTAGGFFKKIDNLIYPWTFSKAGLEAKPYYLTDKDPASHLTYRISTYINNPFVVDNYGLEFDWQTHFWYLPNPLNGLVLNVNYTHILSEAEYPYVYAGATSEKDIDTSFTDRLIHQPNHIVNFTLGYDYKGFSIRSSFLYQDDVFTGVSQWPQLRSSTAPYRRWDISAKQGLPWLGIQLYAWINNLNNAKDLNVLNMYPDTPKTSELYGMTVELGLRLQL